MSCCQLSSNCDLGEIELLGQEEERQAKGDAEETAQRKQQEIKVDVKEEKPLVSSRETQYFEK